MTEAGRTDANRTTYHSLFKWLISTPHKDLISAPCAEDAEQLFLMIDEVVICKDAAWLILEVHPQARRVTDVSIFGKYELLEIPIACGTGFSALWPRFAQGKPGGSDCHPDIWAEFDHMEGGYAFMGFFESFSSHKKDFAVLTDWISYYIQCREPELVHEHGKRVLQQSSDLLNSAAELLGHPAQIGFLNRGSCAVKLVSEFSREMIPSVAEFCRQHFSSNTLGPFSKGETLEQLLEDLCTNDALPRISIDLDLANGRFSNRLSLEEESSSHRGPLHVFRFANYFDNYHKSKELELSLPYAEKRPSPNLVDNEVICIRHSHRKLTLSEGGADVKDYIHITGGRVHS
jgi:hypothetical protein